MISDTSDNQKNPSPPNAHFLQTCHCYKATTYVIVTCKQPMTMRVYGHTFLFRLLLAFLLSGDDGLLWNVKYVNEHIAIV